MDREIIKVILKYWEDYKAQDGLYSEDYSFEDFMKYLEKEVY